MTEKEALSNARCAQTMLPEFARRYLEAVRDGKLQLWAKAVHATVDMLAYDDGAPFTQSAASHADNKEEK